MLLNDEHLVSRRPGRHASRRRVAGKGLLERVFDGLRRGRRIGEAWREPGGSGAAQERSAEEIAGEPWHGWIG